MLVDRKSLFYNKMAHAMIAVFHAAPEGTGNQAVNLRIASMLRLTAEDRRELQRAIIAIKNAE